MEIYNPKKNRTEKKWAIALEQGDGYVKHTRLVAVDAKTGDRITAIMVFSEGGLTVRCRLVKSALENCGYDPYQYNNSWSEDGELEIL